MSAQMQDSLAILLSGIAIGASISALIASRRKSK